VVLGSAPEGDIGEVAWTEAELESAPTKGIARGASRAAGGSGERSSAAGDSGAPAAEAGTFPDAQTAGVDTPSCGVRAGLVIRGERRPQLGEAHCMAAPRLRAVEEVAGARVRAGTWSLADSCASSGAGMCTRACSGSGTSAEVSAGSSGVGACSGMGVGAGGDAETGAGAVVSANVGTAARPGAGAGTGSGTGSDSGSGAGGGMGTGASAGARAGMGAGSGRSASEGAGAGMGAGIAVAGTAVVMRVVAVGATAVVAGVA